MLGLRLREEHHQARALSGGIEGGHAVALAPDRERRGTTEEAFIPAPASIAALHLARRQGKGLVYAGRAAIPSYRLSLTGLIIHNLIDDVVSRLNAIRE